MKRMCKYCQTYFRFKLTALLHLIFSEVYGEVIIEMEDDDDE